MRARVCALRSRRQPIKTANMLYDCIETTNMNAVRNTIAAAAAFGAVIFVVVFIAFVWEQRFTS